MTTYTYDAYGSLIGVVLPDMTAIDFGNIVVGSTATQDVGLRNFGSIELTGNSAIDGDPAFTLDASALAISEGTPATITVDFAPTELGGFTGTVTVTTNDPTTPETTIPIVGSGVEEGGGDDTGVDPGQGGQRGCGCSNASGTPFGAVGVALLGLLSLRRRQ